MIVLAIIDKYVGSPTINVTYWQTTHDCDRQTDRQNGRNMACT